MSREQIAALLRERAHYQKTDKPERVKEVDAELRRLGHEGTPPARRAVKRG